MANRWKFLYEDEGTGKITSRHGGMNWKLGVWEHTDGNINACSNGFHCSKEVWQAFSYIQGQVLARVEVKGGFNDTRSR